jgi:hypothetical protein
MTERVLRIDFEDYTCGGRESSKKKNEIAETQSSPRSSITELKHWKVVGQFGLASQRLVTKSELERSDQPKNSTFIDFL